MCLDPVLAQPTCTTTEDDDAPILLVEDVDYEAVPGIKLDGPVIGGPVVANIARGLLRKST